MSDSIILLIAAAIVALAAWGFWRYLGMDAFQVLSTVMVVVFAVDNLRLRRELRKGREKR